MNEMNGKEIEGEEIEIVLAKPPDKKRKERQAARQASRSTAWVSPSHRGNAAEPSCAVKQGLVQRNLNYLTFFHFAYC